jgi:hypothetical protein
MVRAHRKNPIKRSLKLYAVLEKNLSQQFLLMAKQKIRYA